MQKVYAGNIGPHVISLKDEITNCRDIALLHDIATVCDHVIT